MLTFVELLSEFRGNFQKMISTIGYLIRRVSFSAKCCGHHWNFPKSKKMLIQLMLSFASLVGIQMEIPGWKSTARLTASRSCRRSHRARPAHPQLRARCCKPFVAACTLLSENGANYLKQNIVKYIHCGVRLLQRNNENA